MATIVPPRKRECERCGRRDVWDDDGGTWRIEVVDGDRRTGTPYCLHEWDINGSFSPLASTE